MIHENLSDDECALFALIMDDSGIDVAEFCLIDDTTYDEETGERGDGCWRAYPFQYAWYRDDSSLQIDAAGRSIGKSMSIKLRAFAFALIHAGQEMVITAPEGNHLDLVTDNIETLFLNCKFANYLLAPGRTGIKHRPFLVNLYNGARITGRIPQRDGRGVKGCLVEGEMILTKNGHVPVEELFIGDEVLTHKGRWRPIEAIYTDVNDCYEVSGTGSFPIKVSCDHRFYGSEDSNNLVFQDIQHVLADEFKWATPTTFPEIDFSYPSFSKVNKYLDVEKKEFWWLIGLYLADGYLTNEKEKRWRVNWVSHPENKAREDLIRCLESIGVKYTIKERSHSSADVVEISSTPIATWLLEHFGKLANGKKIPAFALSINKEFRESLLDGYLAGDGHFNESRNRWEAGTASKKLALGIQLLAQSLGFRVGCSTTKPKVTSINGVDLKNEPQTSWRLRITKDPHILDDYSLGKINSVKPIGQQKIYNPIVTEDHSYVSGSIVSHNIHPIWLELDEGQDYPPAGWTELGSTVKDENPNARWRVHGVTRGVGDDFDDRISGKVDGWKIHRLPAMYTPNWNPARKAQRIEQYHGEDSPDYRRNILGLPGDGNSPLFVLHRIFQNVDTDEGSTYNMDEYYNILIDEAEVREVDDIIDLVDPPISHLNYKRVWMGMDFGMTTSASCIVIFGEVKDPKEQNSRLKLLSKIIMKRVVVYDQVKVIKHLMGMYRPMAFAFDAHGVGQPAYDWIQQEVRTDNDIKWMLERVKGYSFSKKMIVDFDENVQTDENDPEGWREAAIERLGAEASIDALRLLVDTKRFIFPYDKDLIGELQAVPKKEKPLLDEYGKPKKKVGQHTLDALRFAALGYSQHAIESMIQQHKSNWTAPSMMILDYS